MIVSLSTIAFAGGSIKMFYNGQEIKADTNPININSRIYMPVRALAEAMGAKVNWDKESNQVNIPEMTRVCRLSVWNLRWPEEQPRCGEFLGKCGPGQKRCLAVCGHDAGSEKSIL